MKIACIAPSRIPSNTANSIQVMKVCQSMVQIGHEVRLWVPGTAHLPWIELSQHYGLSSSFEISWLKSNPGLKRYDLAASAVSKAIKWNADIIYTWLPQASILGQMRGLPVVLEVHDRPTGNFGPWLLKRTVKMHGRKRLAVITRALVSVLEKEFKLSIPAEDLVIAPNGVDLDRYANLLEPAAARSQLGLPPEKLTAVYSGHLYAGRGIDLLFGLAQAFPDVNFLLVGGNAESVESCRKQAAEAGLLNITLTGFIDNHRLPLFQAAGEVLLMPYGRVIAGSGGGNSADICSPMKMFEYMACGRAILVSDLPVFHEVLHDQNAVFCEVENLESWKAGLKDLLENPDRMQNLGWQAKVDALDYTWNSRARAILHDLELPEELT
ncbi:MAG: glycosyltransferase [Bellilinea sp.]